jgi:hypothetical protein
MSRFHDGKKVLPEVIALHALLRGNIGTGDHITDKILDLIDGHLLQGDPVSRYDSKELCRHLDDLLQEGQPVSGATDTTNIEVPDLHVEAAETEAKAISGVFFDAETPFSSDDVKYVPVSISFYIFTLLLTGLVFSNAGYSSGAHRPI